MKKIIKQEQWVMLPTNDTVIDGSIISREIDNELAIANCLTLEDKNAERDGHKNNHIYLTSDDEIKEGDWCIANSTRNISQHHNIDNNLKRGWKKIIATSDKSLKPKCDCSESEAIYCGSKCQKLSPQIPESFIKYYVEKQGEVGDVELFIKLRECPYDSTERFSCRRCDCIDKFSLKLTDNNEIIIDIPIVEEKMYSRDEVKALLWEARKFYNGYATTPYNRVREPFNRWIKENL